MCIRNVNFSKLQLYSQSNHSFFEFRLIIGNVRSCNLFEIGVITLGLVIFYDIGLIIYGISIGLITFCLMIFGLMKPARKIGIAMVQLQCTLCISVNHQSHTDTLYFFKLNTAMQNVEVLHIQTGFRKQRKRLKN